MHKSRAQGPVEQLTVDPFRLVMVGDLTMIPVYAAARGIKADRVRKQAQRKREGKDTKWGGDFPDPVLQFPYYDLYLTSELDEYYFPDGVPDALAEVGTAESDSDGFGTGVSVYAARSGVRPVKTVRESGRTLDYVRVEDSSAGEGEGKS